MKKVRLMIPNISLIFRKNISKTCEAYVIALILILMKPTNWLLKLNRIVYSKLNKIREREGEKESLFFTACQKFYAE